MRLSSDCACGTGWSWVRPTCLVHRYPVIVHEGGLAQDGQDRLDGLRIAVINWRDPWQSVAGGAEEYAWRMSLRLREHGARVHFLTSREPGQRAREERDGIRIRRMGRQYSRYPLILVWLLGHRRGFDAIIDSMNGIPFFTPLVLPRRTRVLLLVHHVHDRQFFIYFPAALAAIGKALETRISRYVYRRHPVIAVSPSTAAVLRERLRWPGPIFVVPNGTPEPGPADPGTEPADGSPALVCVTRLVTHKQVDHIVEAVARLRGTWPGVRLHIVGRGPEYPVLVARIAELGMSGNVRLHGYLSKAGKTALLAGADLHITASEFEGWGLSVIEAAAVGVPTVAYDVDGLRDAVRDGETGWLAPPGEDLADALARAVKELSDPVRRLQVGAACTQWAGRFSWADSGTRLARLIRAACSAPVGRRPGGRAYVARYTDGAGHRSVLVEATDPIRLRGRLGRMLAARGGEVVDIRPATPVEVLTGRPGTGP